MVTAQIAELSMTLHLGSDWSMAAENVTAFFILLGSVVTQIGPL